MKKRYHFFLVAVGVSLMMLFSGFPIQARTPVIHETELREFLRTAWETGDPGLASWLMPGIDLFLDTDQSLVSLDRIIRAPERYPYSTRVQALYTVERLMPGSQFGPYVQRLFADSREGAFRREMIRILSRTDNWIPFFWSILEAKGLEGEPPDELAFLQLEAFRALARWQVLDVLPVLIRYLTQQSPPSVFFLEAQTFLEYYDHRAFPYLSACLQSTDVRIRWMVLPALVRMGPEGREAGYEMTQDPSPEVRNRAILELLKTPPVDLDRIAQVDSVAHCLVEVYRTSLTGQGRLGCLDGFSERHLLSLLAQTGPGIQWLIGSVRGKVEAEWQLIKALGDLDDVYPDQALWDLLEKHRFPAGSWGKTFPLNHWSDRIVLLLDERPDLLPVLVDPEVPVSRETLKPHLFRLRTWLRQDDGSFCRIILALLPVLGDEALPLLEPLLADQSERVSTEVVNTLRRIPSPATVRFLEHYLDHPSRQVQVLSRLALLEYFQQHGVRLIWLSR